MHDIRSWANDIPDATEGLEAQIRFAPVLTRRDEHISSFAIFRLHAALEDFGVGQFEGAAVIDWYWRTAPSWPKQSTQEAFDRYARAALYRHGVFRRRDADPHGDLCVCYINMGEFDKALAECQEALRLSPDDVSNYSNLGAAYLGLSRLDER